MSTTEERLQKTLWDLQKLYGDNIVSTLAQRDAARDGIETGYPALDAALISKGIPCGRISTIVGKPSCGATTLALHLLAHAQGSSAAAVYLDYTRMFDPHYAAHCGVDPDRLMLIHPKDTLQTLEIARDFSSTGFPALVIIDLLTSHLPEARTAVPIPLRRLHEGLGNSRTAVLFLLRASRDLAALDAYTHTCLQLERQEWIFDGSDVIGYRTRVTVMKDKPAEPGHSVMLDITFDPDTEGDA